MIPPVILASQSPRRRELLEKTGIPFSIIVRGTEELKEASMPPQELCLHNAAAKAETVFQEHPDSTVIGADTLVFLEGFPLGKPEDEEEARSMLRKLSGRTHHVCTAVAIVAAPAASTAAPTMWRNSASLELVDASHAAKALASLALE